jgi:hypothetical protein
MKPVKVFAFLFLIRGDSPNILIQDALVCFELQIPFIFVDSDNSKCLCCCTRILTHVSGKQIGRKRTLCRLYLQIATELIGSVGNRCIWAVMFTWRSIQKKRSVSWYRNILPSSVHICLVFLNLRTLCVLLLSLQCTKCGLFFCAFPPNLQDDSVAIDAHCKE